MLTKNSRTTNGRLKNAFIDIIEYIMLIYAKRCNV